MKQLDVKLLSECAIALLWIKKTIRKAILPDQQEAKHFDHFFDAAQTEGFERSSRSGASLQKLSKCEITSYLTLESHVGFLVFQKHVC